jgi:hypothetical protein
MARPFPRSIPAQLAFANLCAGLITASASTPGLAQQKGYGQALGTTPREAEVYDNHVKPGVGGGQPPGSPNILGLLDKLRGDPSRVDPTPPGSAIDQALQEFDAQAVPADPTPSQLLMPGS